MAAAGGGAPGGAGARRSLGPGATGRPRRRDGGRAAQSRPPPPSATRRDGTGGKRLWHRLDGGKRFCAIRDIGPLLGPEDKERAAYPHGLALEEWADTYGYVFPTSPSALLPIRTDIALQVEWLQRQRPNYLLTFASNARSLAEHCLEYGIALPGLERVLTFGEVLTPETRAACRAAWGALVLDTYSTAEIGYIASQCPTTSTTMSRPRT